ncbi:uncharacterized protein PF3D7_1120000-like isoform X2 [Prorops nasuta]
MLEKMGWTHGKGLGAQEQGATEHIRINFKNDKGGFGFNSNCLDQAWTENQEGFNSLLQQLQETQGAITAPEKVDTSLETLSKNSHARLHYKKFIRGKDVKKYSAKDLANIFGKKELGESRNVKERMENESSPATIGSQEVRSGVLTINRGTISNYFKNKSPNFLLNCDKKHDDSENINQYCGFGFSEKSTPKSEPNIKSKSMPDTFNYAFENPCINLNSSDEISVEDSNSTPKKRKYEFIYENEGLDLEYPENSNNTPQKLKKIACHDEINKGFDNPVLDLDSNVEENFTGKKFEVLRPCVGVTNDALDLTDENSNKKHVTFNDNVEYSSDVVKKKKGKAKLDKFEVDNTKLKRKRKREREESVVTSLGIVNEALDPEVLPNEMLDNALNEQKCERSKICGKRRRMSNLETIPEAPEEETEREVITIYQDDEENNEEITILEEVQRIRTKKKKLNKQSKEDDADMKSNQSLATMEKKKKKHKKSNEEPNKEMGDNVDKNLKEAENMVQNEEVLFVKTKKSKKGKKRIEMTKWFDVEELQEDEVHGDDKPVDTATDVKQKKKLERLAANEVEEKEASGNENNQHVEKFEEHGKPKKRKKSGKTSNISYLSETVHKKERVTLKVTEELNEENRDVNINIEESVDKEIGVEIVETCTNSPWKGTTRMSKKVLKSLMLKKAVLNFPGSNIHELKGYGADVE